MTDTDTEEEILEPTPYENAYRRTLKDDVETPEAPDPELLDIPDGDTQEVEGMIQAQDEKEHDWKKRYSDLKSYHDRKNNEWLQQNELTEAKLKLAEQKAKEEEDSRIKNFELLKLKEWEKKFDEEQKRKEQEEILKDEKIKQRELESIKSKEAQKDESEQNLSGRLENFEVDKTTKN